MDPQVDRVLVAAAGSIAVPDQGRAVKIDIHEQISETAYCVNHAVGDALVMRIPRSELANDGPFLTSSARPDPRVLLDSSTDRARGLPSFVDRLELAGVPVALHARAIGRRPEPGDLRAIARALATLHETVPYHGHLTPAHIVVGDTIAFTDLLPEYPNLLGGIGYALPIHGDPALRDVAALIAIAAELAGAPLAWGREVASFLEAVNRGGSHPWDPQPMLAALYATYDGWICAAGRLCLDHYLPIPSVSPATARPREPVAGTARALLVDHARYAALGSLMRTLFASPSLFDFLVLERAAAIESTERAPDPIAALSAADASFAAIDAALPPLRALYKDEPVAPVPPHAHHADVAEELMPLRSMLIDLDRLLAPVPGTPIGGLLARVTENFEALRDPARRAAAVRRYLNYVSDTHRVYPTG